MTNQLLHKIVSIFGSDQETKDLFFSLLRGLDSCEFDLSTIRNEAGTIPETYDYNMRMSVYRLSIARISAIALIIDETTTIHQYLIIK